MSGIVNLLWFVLILGAIVIVHEFGHLLAAKKFGVYCKEFSIGMGPLLWQKQKGETAWSIRALPIGGFVAMAGEDVYKRQVMQLVKVLKNARIILLKK